MLRSDHSRYLLGLAFPVSVHLADVAKQPAADRVKILSFNGLCSLRLGFYKTRELYSHIKLFCAGGGRGIDTKTTLKASVSYKISNHTSLRLWDSVPSMHSPSSDE